MAKYSPAQRKSAEKWNAANLDRFGVAAPAELGAEIRQHVAGRGETVNRFFIRAAKNQIKIDNEEENRK